MPVYQFTATDQNGAPSQGTFEAPNEEQAFAHLAQYGLTVSQLVPVQEQAVAAAPAAGTTPPLEPEEKAAGKKSKKKAKAEKALKSPKTTKKKKKGGILAIELGGSEPESIGKPV